MLKWEEATMKRYETWKQERNRLMVHVFVCMLSQVIILYLLFQETKANFNWKAIVLSNASLNLLLAKVICAMILHLAMQKNVTQGNEMMKFALNHPHKFLWY